MPNPYESVVGAAANPYEALVQNDAAGQLRDSMASAVDKQPDVEARINKLAQQYQIPVTAVRLDTPEVERRAKLDALSYDEIVRQTPRTANFLGNPKNAAIAHDDVDNLAQTEGVLGKLAGAAVDVGKYVVSAPGAMGGGMLSDIGRAARAVASGAPKAGAGLYGMAAAPFELVGADALGSWLRGQQKSADAVAGFWSPVNPNAGIVERGVMSGLQSAGQNLITLPLGLAGKSDQVMLGTMGAITAGQSYGKGRDKGLSPARAVPYAVQDAVAEVVTERYLGASGFLQAVKAGSSAGKLFMYELAREVPGEMAATLWQNFNEWANLNPEKSVAQFVQEQPAALAETAIATLVGGGVQIGAVKSVERAMGRRAPEEAAAKQGEAQGQVLQELMALAAASKLRERDATTFAGFLQQATEDGPLEKVYINPKEMHEAGIDLTAIAQLAPDMAPHITAALDSGTDVALPTAQLLAAIPGTELEQNLIEHLKTDPGGFSAAGAKAYMQNQAESAKQEVEKALAQHEQDITFKTSMKAVEDNVLRQLQAANRFTDDVNQPYAALWSAFFGVQAARAGVMPQELFDRFGPRIVAQSPGGNVLEQGAVDSPEFRNWFGDSKVVDAQGKPQVVYHGTRGDFEAFDRGQAGKTTGAGNAKLGFFFTDRADVAGRYARMGSDQQGQQSIVPAHLSLRNPVRLTAQNMMEADKLLEVELRPAHDGAIISVGEGDTAQTVYMVRNSTQVKSATGNRGTFDANDPNILHQTAYHGSPHDFDRFSTDAIGTGEGNQAYGWGLYFAENQGVAKQYADKVKDMAKVTRIYEELRVLAKTMEQDAVPGAYRQYRTDAGRKAAEHYDALMAERDRHYDAPGKLYQVEIPDAVADRMLLWDKPLSEQPPAVKEALKKAGVSGVGPIEGADHKLRSLNRRIDAGGADADAAMREKQALLDELNSADPEGQLIYRNLSASLWKRPADGMIRGRLQNDRAASELLESIGIPGVKYLDGGSRSDGDGSYNLVVFNDKNVQLTHKNGSPVTAAERAEFFQGKEEGARGTFNPDTNTVALLQAADLSTFLHESGHFFLEVMDDLAAQPNAPKQVVDDFATFLKWTGVESPEAWRAMSLDEKRAHHEDFARGFEAYLFEGKAPNIELQGVFQRFRAWLLNVYRSLASLNIHLPPEVRGVFDRMLATTEQIQLAEDVRGYEALFKNKPEGMTEDEWAVYQLQSSDATQQAVTDLEKRSLGDMKWLANAKSRELKKLQAEAKARRDEIAAEVRKEVEAEPVYQAIAAIKEQRKSDPHDREAVKAWTVLRDAEEERLTGIVKAQYLDTPEGQGLAGLRKGQFLAKNKRAIANEVEKSLLQWEQQNPKPKVDIPEADLEAVAQLHGFTSGDELRRAIMETPPLNDVVEGMVDQRMLERHGDLVTPEAIERAAEEAIHNEARMRFVATETNALRKAVGQPALLAKAVRQFAADIVARTRVRDLKPGFYTAAEKRSARDAEKAMRENKLEDAAIQKRNQLVNGYAAKESMDAQDEAAKVVRYLAKFNKDSAGKSLDADYLEQIHNLLERFDLRPASNKAIDKRTSLKTWLEAQAEAGMEPDIPPELVEEANRTHFKNLTMEQLRGLRDTVKQIEHLGRLKHKLLTAKDQRDYEAIRDSIVASIHEHAGDKVANNRTRPTVVDASLRMAKSFVLEHRKLASLIREMDGFQDGGVFWDYMVRTMNEAGDREASMRAEAATKLAALVRPMLAGGKRGGKGQFFPSVGASFNREERLGMALNMGNAGNLQRLLDGEGWTLPQVKPIVDTLTAADWQFVQGVWDFLESYRPLIAEKERRVYGKEPEWVESQPLTVETADGKRVTLRGGYFPVKYDARRSQGAEQNDEKQKAKEQMQGAFTSTTTRRSFTKSRVEAVTGRPLLYSTDALFNGVNEIIHDLSWHEWLIDANRLLRSKSIDNAIRTRYGAEVVRQIKSAIKDIAAGEFPATHAFERGLGELRAGTAVAGLGLNIMNSIINVQGLTQSMVRIGAKWTAVGIGRFASGPIELSQEVASKSAMMANRAKTLNREVNEIQSLVRDKSKVRQAADRIMFMPLTITQQLVDLPTWWGAYQKALSEGQPEDRAVSMADQSVLDAQSGGQVKDLSAIQRGGPLLKLWTTFYGFFNSTYNLTVESTKATDFRNPGQVLGLVTNYLLLWTIPALLGTLLKNALTGGDWDEDKLAKKMIGDQISYLMGMMVGLRDFAGAAQSAAGVSEFNLGYGGPSGGRFFGEVYKLAQQANQGEMDFALFKALDNVVGILFKLPSGQINRTAQGVAALNEGKTQNPAAVAFGYDDRH